MNWRSLIRDACLTQAQQYIDMAVRADDRGLQVLAAECTEWAEGRLADWRKSLRPDGKTKGASA